MRSSSLLLTLAKAASDCSIIHNANPSIFKIKCCNMVLFGIQCESSRVVKIDDSELRLTNSDIYFDNLFPVLASLTEWTEISISADRINGAVSLPPDLGHLVKLQTLTVIPSIDTLREYALHGTELPSSLINCTQLQVLQVLVITIRSLAAAGLNGTIPKLDNLINLRQM